MGPHANVLLLERELSRQVCSSSVDWKQDVTLLVMFLKYSHFLARGLL